MYGPRTSPLKTGFFGFEFVSMLLEENVKSKKIFIIDYCFIAASETKFRVKRKNWYKLVINFKPNAKNTFFLVSVLTIVFAEIRSREDKSL